MAKKSKGEKPSQHLSQIISVLNEHPGMSTGELANALGLSSSRAREILTAEVKRGHIERKQAEEDGAQVFQFFNVVKGDDDLMDAGDELANEQQAADAPDDKPIKEAKRGRKSTMTGRGNPEAKKAINPQATLEAKKAIAKEAGGTMTWAGRLWHIKGPEFDFTMTSREIATFTLDSFRKKVGV